MQQKYHIICIKHNKYNKKLPFFSYYKNKPKKTKYRGSEMQTNGFYNKNYKLPSSKL